jgi:hypothetical protein
MGSNHRNPSVRSDSRRLRASTGRNVALGLTGIVVLAAAIVAHTVMMTPRGSLGASPSATQPHSSPDPSAAAPVSPTVATASAPASTTTPPVAASGGPKILFGMGTEADAARHTALVKQAPVKMLTSWYNGPNDLLWMTNWRYGTVPTSYAAGYAMHLVVYSNDHETMLSTAQGTACGREYPLSTRFVDDMRRLAETFAGPAHGPPLYVTLFTEFQTYACVDNGWSPDQPTTNYYLALKDQYRTAHQVFHQHAANARVSLGWGGWQANYDDPDKGAGRSMFAHFDDVMRMSDFQSFQAMSSKGNADDIRSMVSTLGVYGPVMLAHYKPDNGSQATFSADMRTILTESFLSTVTAKGLFAMSFMDASNLSADPAVFEFVKGRIAAFATDW